MALCSSSAIAASPLTPASSAPALLRCCRAPLTGLNRFAVVASFSSHRYIRRREFFHLFRLWVLSPSCMPEITDEASARADPELAVLSVVVHGRDTDVEKVAKIALATQAALA